MFCPNCGSEYREGFSRCSDCDIALVDALPQEREDIDLVKVFETNDPVLADVVTSVLRARPIEFVIRDAGPTAIVRGLANPVQFWVAEGDESAARECIAEIIDQPAEVVEDHEESSGPIYSIQITHYSRETGRSDMKEIKAPSLEVLEHEIRTMDPYEKPIVFVLTSFDNTESDCMAITGGGGVYHLQISDPDAEWREAVNPSRGDANVEIWTSDQGFTTAERFTWNTEDALRIAKYYWEHQEPAPDIQWT